MSNNTVIYAGSFDPITNGHTDMIEKHVSSTKVIVSILEES